MTEQQIELQMRVFNERTLEWLYEQRREFINRHNLNKFCEHEWIRTPVTELTVCEKCGKKA